MAKEDLEKRVAQLERELNRMKGSWARATELLSIIEQRGFAEPYKLVEKIYDLDREVKELKTNFWDVMENDPQASRAFITRLRTEIAHEVEEAALFTVYEENPQVVINVIKEAVEDKLSQWEFNEQVTYRLVDKVFNEQGYFDRVMDRMYGIVNTKEFAEQIGSQMAGYVAEYLVQNYLGEIMDAVMGTSSPEEFIEKVADKVKDRVVESEEANHEKKVDSLLRSKAHICITPKEVRK